MTDAGAAGPATVVGGANVDIEGRSLATAVRGDSNPGRVSRSAGGVSRNIANNLANLGVATRLITVLGSDPDGQWLHDVTAAAGVDLDGVLWSQGRTATYLSIVDADGELLVAVNDMAVLDDLDARALDDRAELLAGASVLVADCNLTPDALDAVASAEPPLFVDTVSAAKADRILPHLGRVHTLKPNRLEAELLTGVEITDDRSLRQAATDLLDRGVGRVVISLGAAGILVADADGITTIDAPHDDVVSVTGAGDAMMAGLVLAHLAGHRSTAAARFGLAAAALTAASPVTVRPDLDEATLTRYVTERLC